MKKKITMRRSLITSFILLILILSTLLLATIVFFGYRYSNQLSVSYFNNAITQTNSKIESVTTPILNALFQTKRSFETGLLDVNDTENLNRFFTSIMEQVPFITSINTGDSEGKGYLILKSGDNWRNRLVQPKTWDTGNVKWLRFNRDMEILENYMEKLDYDPRKRPWYKKTINSKDLNLPVWTQPYIFKTTNEPGVTVSIQIILQNKKPFVLAFDIKSKDISTFTTNFRPSPNGKIFVMMDNGKISGLPADLRFKKADEINKYILKDYSDLGIKEITKAVNIWQNSDRPDGKTFKISATGKKWWCMFKQLENREDNPSWVCTLIPSSDILGNVILQFLFVLSITALCCIIAAILAIVISKKYTDPINTIVQQVKALRKLDVKPQKTPKSSIMEILHLTETNERMRIALDAFSRYIPIDIVRQLLDRGEAAKIGGITSDITILFTDIRNFTSISESMPPMELALQLEEYFNIMLEELKHTNATIDKFIGDSIMVFWGAPIENPKHALGAVETVWNCTKKLDELNNNWRNLAKPEFITTFGIVSGEAVVGNVGASSRLNYTALGDNVNLAHRIEELNKFYGTEVLVNSSVVSQTNDNFLFRHVDRVAVKGKALSHEIYELLGPINKVSESKKQFKTVYEDAFKLYLNQGFSKTISYLENIDSHFQNDKSIQLLKETCISLIKNAPCNDWKGVRNF